jgi:transposase, IS30 family
VRYHQLTSEERYALSALRKQRLSQAEIARTLGRHPSTIGRELKRNSRRDGGYRPFTAGEKTRGRRSRSRRNQQFTPNEWALVVHRLKDLWSPEQISGRLALEGLLSISHETIYRYIWKDRRAGGSLHTYLRQDPKRLRKRYGRYDSRGRLAGKRPLADRPPGAQNRSRVGHLEGDTVIGSSDNHCILTLVDRKTGHTMIGKLHGRTTKAVNRRAASLIRNAPRRTRTLTFDNGTEFHGYKKLKYLPKRTSMVHVTQRTCTRIAAALNNRPRKRLGYRTLEKYMPRAQRHSHRCTSNLTLRRRQ